MINFFSAIKTSSQYRKIEVNELLFAEYTCMQENTKFGIWSDNNYFAFISSGKKIWHTAYHSYEVNEGDVLFVKKGANITRQFFTDDFCAIFIFIPDDFIKLYISKNIEEQGRKPKNISTQDSVLRIHDSGLLKSYFHSIQSFLHLPELPNKQLLMLKFEELLVSISQYNKNQELLDYFVSLLHHSESQMQYIMEQNFVFNLKLEEFAKLTSRSLSAFKRDFKKLYKTTPGKWLLTKRLQYARQLLLHSGKNISEIAFESGFENLSHFSRSFKQYYGVAPSSVTECSPGLLSKI